MVPDSRLGRSISGCTGNAHQARARGHVDDGARFLGAHRLDRITAAQKRSVQIDRVDAVPFGQCCVFGVMRAWAIFEPSYARIIHDDVDAWLLVGHIVPILFGRDIKRNKSAADFGCDPHTVFGINVADDDHRTFLREAAGNRLANPAGTASHERGFIL